MLHIRILICLNKLASEELLAVTMAVVPIVSCSAWISVKGVARAVVICGIAGLDLFGAASYGCLFVVCSDQLLRQLAWVAVGPLK